jgi:hypothetical protein
MFGSDSHGESREAGMDSSFTIKPRPPVQKTYALRDPVPVREAVETDLSPSQAAAAGGDGAPHRDRQQDLQQDHAPHDMVADPDSRDVIYRENDVRTHANEPVHPDQALLRLRAYRPTSGTEGPADGEPHANIKA